MTRFHSGLVAALTLLASSAAFASEKAILDAVQSGVIPLTSEIALPEAVDAAPPAPGDANASAHFLYAITRAEEATITDKAFPLSSAKWPFNVVFVCWENPSTADEQQRRLVREAVAATWEKQSALKFLGWQPCAADTTGIRILIEDRGPHVKALGKFVDGMTNGMVLNFTFRNWSRSCQNTLDYCIRGIAVHEFGHAIGFAHEQNRPDTPGECEEPAQGSSGDVLLTPWDPHSVMNYCNPKYNNDGELSAFDIKAVQYMYGASGG